MRRFLASIAVLLSAAYAAVMVARAQDPPPGKAPYDRVCKVCHGTDGKGDAAPALVPFELEDEDLLIRVREGGGEMPPISANRVSDEQVKQIAAYLRGLSSH